MMVDKLQMTDAEYSRRNPPPLLIKYDRIRDIDFIEIMEDPEWLSVGYIPVPRTRLGWFLYHLVHGLVMKYPAHKVLFYALNNMAPCEIVELV